MPPPGISAGPTVYIRQDTDVVRTLSWTAATSAQLAQAAPWRRMRWYRGQQHYSGLYWSKTMGAHVLYESRLELARLLLADFDPRVRSIVAQPFLLKCTLGGVERSHVPDYLLLGEGDVTVVDVKPRHRLAVPEVARTFGWTRELVASRGWRYEVWSQADPTVLANVRFLAGYRSRAESDVLSALRLLDLDGCPLGDLHAMAPDWRAPMVRAGAFHLLWTQELAADLAEPLSARTLLSRSVS